MNQGFLPRLRPRDPNQEGRSATPLELFFDLVFVVAVALASQNLHHFLSEDHIGDGVTKYLTVFFGVWWAWMNFTWFATAFDSDDWLYRVLTLVQMAGALVMAAGVPDYMNESDLSVMVGGYVIMRLAMVCQWLRAAHGSPAHRATALRYAVGIILAQTYWVALLIVPDSVGLPLFLVGVVIELAVPVIAESANQTPWHAHHITERYGLFTIIVLGESILASSNTIIEAIEEASHIGDLLTIAVSGFVVVAAIWWLYFAYPQHQRIGGVRDSVLWGYGHYLIFASAAAVSAGIEVAVDFSTHHTELGEVKAAATLSVPVAVFLLAAWWLVIRPNGDPVVNLATPATVVLIVLAAFVPFSLPVTAIILAGLVALVTWRTHGAHGPVHG
jgi:low temperature requirement protein LtrA